MDQIARIRWDCVEWHPYHGEPLSTKRGKEYGLTLLRGRLMVFLYFEIFFMRFIRLISKNINSPK